MVVSALLTGPAAVPAAVAEPMEQAGQVVGGYGDLLWMSLGLVVAVGVIAVIAARLLGGGRGWRRGGASGLMEVVARQPLEPRRSLYVVRVGQRRILVGTSELGVTMLTELDVGQEAAPAPEVGAASFAELVKDAARQWAGKRKAKAAGVVAHRAEQAAGGASQKADDGAASQADDGAAGQAASASNREGARGAARAEERVPS